MSINILFLSWNVGSRLPSRFIRGSRVRFVFLRVVYSSHIGRGLRRSLLESLWMSITNDAAVSKCSAVATSTGASSHGMLPHVAQVTLKMVLIVQQWPKDLIVPEQYHTESDALRKICVRKPCHRTAFADILCFARAVPLGSHRATTISLAHIMKIRGISAVIYVDNKTES